MLESQLQRKIIVTLEMCGWYVIKLIQTNKNGIPDLLVLKNKRAVFIEVKTEGNKPSPLQEHRAKELEIQSFETIIAYALKDIEQLCTEPRMKNQRT